MDRREFVKQVGLVLAAGWAAGPEVRLALLADAHLKDGNEHRPEALALARAVAEINTLSPRPDLVLFAGDLAHRGRPDALDLGREILADLPGPCWPVRGEGDHGPGGNAAWVRRWGGPCFSRAFRGLQVLGLDTTLSRGTGGPVFEIGAIQRRWLARELARLSPSSPLIVLSHAPLARVFHPWQQWTGDAPEVAQLLGQFFPGAVPPRAYAWGGDRGQGSGTRGQGPGVRYDDDVDDFRISSLTQNHLSLPATAWPRPLAVQGTPATQRRGRGPRGCGWALVTLSETSRNFQPYLWQA